MNKYSKFFNTNMSSNEARLEFFKMGKRVPKSEISALKEAYFEAVDQILKREDKEFVGCLTE